MSSTSPQKRPRRPSSDGTWGGARRRPRPHRPPCIVRERLLSAGPEGLAEADLLGLLLAPGARRGRGGELAERLLAHFGDVRRLAAASPGEILAAAHIPPRVVARLAAAFALGRAAHATRLVAGRALVSSREIFDAFHARLRDLRKERFLTVLLDGRHRVLREVVVSEGILTASLVHPREVFAPAIRESAGGLVLVHNHPSGDPEPSPEDLEVTRRLAAVGDLVGIRVLDHVVIGDARYVSFLERGLMGP